jgi:hypothetical protein
MFGTPTIEIKARLDAEGNVTAKAVGRCSYGDRFATVDADITDEAVLEAFGKAFAKALKSPEADLRQAATSAAAECLVIATKKGETV